MKLLVTGGFGYIGGRLAQYLASQPCYEILMGSRQHTEPPPWLLQAKVVPTLWDSPAGLEAICTGVDAIVHLAGMNAQECSANPIAALEFNAVATARLLQAAVRQGVKRFIYLSTAHVYGSPLSGMITEDSCPLSLHPYATSHRSGEDVVRATHQSEKIEGIVIRLSNAFGAPAHKDTNCWMLLVNDLCQQAVTSGKLELRSSGLQLRDFITLKDVTMAIEHLLALPIGLCNNGLFNLGGECSLQIIDFTERIASRCNAVLNFPPPIIRPKPASNEVSIELDYCIDKLKATGFSLTGDIDAEIDATLLLCQDAFGLRKL